MYVAILTLFLLSTTITVVSAEGCCQWPFSPYTNSASKPPMDFECSEPLSVLCQLYVVEPDKAAGVAGYQLNDENYDILQVAPSRLNATFICNTESKLWHLENGVKEYALIKCGERAADGTWTFL
ncbi:C6 domain-containing protein [Caenorhabditis elegans]|uniref:C6 domain-containing protein n=1 Tax=Caenorhabditis elegans TaxID=6239 RepID=B5BM22_CAEEL|nr:C6 domain-containing protein [Caenorhabditis elegans]CAR31476.1 C6 domain-containing protein [Caenorhabditis elegans]|eukprot:NP_001129805.1 Uncharacterized protein CELE_C05C10.8 [Caenorhabditis elegans]